MWYLENYSADFIDLGVFLKISVNEKCFMEVKNVLKSILRPLEPIVVAKGAKRGQMWYLENYSADLIDLDVIVKVFVNKKCFVDD